MHEPVLRGGSIWFEYINKQILDEIYHFVCMQLYSHGKSLAVRHFEKKCKNSASQRTRILEEENFEEWSRGMAVLEVEDM